ncbi:hypothetical protein SAMN05421796_11066 [Chryseobacterium piscicola]|uniref:Uncharacterized protein n=1 Tax=Chryseobacterium piscicola TaxID=551459 RepID=A0A1N7P1A8_9FLAO|nr:hypothetical protein [Chryseobacterium piscicola]PQA92750.1 hypothetical protein B0A70_10215 [Chryseobacterium piscicola]SIT04344.1 hypothetical protein SAMN05421796_11066 [Chryseobacterium piscicola]
MYCKTSLKDIAVSNTGSVKNLKTNQILKISKRGYFTYNSKPISIVKLMLETFKDIKIRTGQIKFIDGNDQNFFVENIEYKTKLQKISRPSETAILEIIKYYFGSNAKINIKDVFNYRMQLKTVLDLRDFFKTHKSSLFIEIFEDYFSFHLPSFSNLAKRNNVTVNDARRTVYFFLNKLIEDCYSDKIIKL